MCSVYSYAPPFVTWSVRSLVGLLDRPFSFLSSMIPVADQHIDQRIVFYGTQSAQKVPRLPTECFFTLVPVLSPWCIVRQAGALMLPSSLHHLLVPGLLSEASSSTSSLCARMPVSGGIIIIIVVSSPTISVFLSDVRRVIDAVAPHFFFVREESSSVRQGALVLSAAVFLSKAPKITDLLIGEYLEEQQPPLRVCELEDSERKTEQRTWPTDQSTDRTYIMCFIVFQ